MSQQCVGLRGLVRAAQQEADDLLSTGLPVDGDQGDAVGRTEEGSVPPAKESLSHRRKEADRKEPQVRVSGRPQIADFRPPYPGTVWYDRLV